MEIFSLILIAISLFIGLVIIFLIFKSQSKIENFENQIEKLERSLREEFSRNREEQSLSLKNFSENLFTQMRDISQLQKDQLNNFSTQLNNLNSTNREELNKLRETLERQLKSLQDDNSSKLELMRKTVDEKLQETLERRLGESFMTVSTQLEQVHKGLGEMQNLATGVGDLKKVLTNVKTRGTWGEIQLGNLLEQILTIDQFSANVATKKRSQERVDFAIKLPGAQDSSEPVLLPIDAKFPQEDYQRLLEAQEAANSEMADQAIKQLEQRIKSEARSIRDKYIDPPATTDFALMFLATEGLYAEVLKRPNLAEQLQRDYRVIVTGPTTISALLNSLQIGFRTLTIQKRSSEVWNILASIKLEFSRFGDLLDKTKKKMEEATNVIDSAARKSRNIETKLKRVEALPGLSSEENRKNEPKDEAPQSIEFSPF